MKRFILLPMMIFFIGMLCVSCSSDDTFNWDEDGWSNTSYAMNRYNDISYIEVPVDGGVCTFHYNSSESISIDTLFMDNNIERPKSSYARKYKYTMVGNQILSDYGVMCNVGINAQDVKVEIAPNNDFTRRAIINLNVGNKKIQLRFWQKPIGQSNGALKSLLGDWVFDLDATNKEFGTNYSDPDQVPRYSFHEDGTYYSSLSFRFSLPTSSSGSNYGYDFPEFGVWKDSCGVLIMSGIGVSGYSSNKRVMDYRVSGGKFYTPGQVFERMENTRFVVAPYYTLELKRKEENLPYPLKAGEPVTLESKLYAKGANFTMNDVNVLCNRMAREYFEGFGYRWSEKMDSMDVSKYLNDKYEFSLPLTYPDSNNIVRYWLTYTMTLHRPNDDFNVEVGASTDYFTAHGDE